MPRRKFVPRADDTRPRESDKPKTGCQCRNHLGTPKQQHKTHADALAYAISHTKYSGLTRIYRCPSSDRWHVTTKPDRSAT